MLVDLERDDPRWAQALPVLQELRPHLTRELLDEILDSPGQQTPRFTAMFVGDQCVAVAGWRVVANTYVIRQLYVDDLVTAAAHRSSGYGAKLLDSLALRGRELGCRQLSLDSGVQRYSAHRFYLRQRMDITCHHFALSLD